MFRSEEYGHLSRERIVRAGVIANKRPNLSVNPVVLKNRFENLLLRFAAIATNFRESEKEILELTIRVDKASNNREH